MCTVNKHDRSPLNWLLGSLIKHPLFSKKKLNLKKNAMSGSKVFSDFVCYNNTSAILYEN